MQRLRRQGVAALAAAMMLLGASGSSWAKTVKPVKKARTRSHADLKRSARAKAHPVAMRGEEVVPGVMPEEAPSSETATLTPTPNPTSTPASQEGKPYKLRMMNLHTGESLDIVYRIGNLYVPEALEKLNYFLRDHNTQDVIDYSPKEFDVLHALMSRLGRLNSVIDIVCGYRTPETNAALRRNSPRTGVAEHSQHMEGHAIDIRVPGVSTARLRNAALSLRAGGVGYYPKSQFVHVDVGPVRQWSFGRAPRRVYRHRNRVRVGE